MIGFEYSMVDISKYAIEYKHCIVPIIKRIE